MDTELVRCLFIFILTSLVTISYARSNPDTVLQELQDWLGASFERPLLANQLQPPHVEAILKFCKLLYIRYLCIYGFHQRHETYLYYSEMAIRETLPPIGICWEDQTNFAQWLPAWKAEVSNFLLFLSATSSHHFADYLIIDFPKKRCDSLCACFAVSNIPATSTSKRLLSKHILQ